MPANIKQYRRHIDASSNNLHAALFDHRGTNEATIQAAIDAAVDLGKTGVIVPDSLLPYTPSSVTFDASVRMILETGDDGTHQVDVYGASASGIQAAIDAAAQQTGTKIVRCQAKTYTISQPITISTNDIILDLNGALFQRSYTTGYANRGIIELTGTATATTTTLTATSNQGDNTLTVASISGFAAGNWILIESSETYATLSNVYTDVQRVKTASGSTLTLHGKVRHDFDTGSGTVTVTLLTPVERCQVLNGRVQHGTATDDGNLIRMAYAISCKVANIEGYDHRSAGVHARYSTMNHFDRVYIHDTNDTSSDGYGLQLWASHANWVTHCVGSNNRHSFDIARGSAFNVLNMCESYGDASDGFVVGHGQLGHNNVLANSAVYNAGAVGVHCGNSSYNASNDNRFINVQAWYCGTDGFRFRESSLRNRLENCLSIGNGNYGYRVVGGDADDNSFTNCEARSNTSGGALFEARVHVSGGNYSDNGGGEGVELVAGAEDSVIENVKATGNPSFGVFVSSCDRVTVYEPYVRANSADGIRVATSEDVLVVQPTCRSNTGWGVNITGGEASSRGSQVVGGIYTGNTSGSVTQGAGQKTPVLFNPRVNSITYAASITPDLEDGTIFEVGTLTGAITVNAIANPSYGARATFKFTQDGTGGRVVTWDAVYKENWSPDTATSKINTIDFYFDGTNWIQTGAVTGI